MANTFKFGNGNWAVKDGYALAYNDENNNFKPLPFEFTRASTATTLNRQGLVETVGSGKPRIDFLDNTSGHLLLEPSRTNISPDSERMDLWSSLRTTETINSGVSPDGTNTAVKVAMTSDTGEHSVYDGVSVTSGTSYTNSIFIKRGTGSADWQYFQFRFRNGGFGTGGGVVVDIHNGTITFNSGLTDYGIENYGNGWYRVFITQTATTTSSSAGPVLAFNEISNGYDVSIVGNTNADVLLWGSQFEAGSYATSYIPTEGSSVTRVAENTTTQDNVPSTVIGQTEGTVYTEFKIYETPTGTQRIIILSDGTGNERIGIAVGSGILYAFIVDGGTTQCEIVKSSFTGGTYKVAFGYKANDFVLYLNGVQVGTDNSGSVSSCDRIDLGNQFNANQLEGNIIDAKLYNTRLTNTELQNLTS